MNFRFFHDNLLLLFSEIQHASPWTYSNTRQYALSSSKSEHTVGTGISVIYGDVSQRRGLVNQPLFTCAGDMQPAISRFEFCRPQTALDDFISSMAIFPLINCRETSLLAICPWWLSEPLQTSIVIDQLLARSEDAQGIAEMKRLMLRRNRFGWKYVVIG